MRTLAVFAFLAAAAACGGKSHNQHDDAGVPDAPPDGPQTTEVVCETLPPTTSGATCDVSGTGANKLLKGIVLTPSTVYRGGQVAVDAGGQITCVGCGCAAGGETVITCPDGAISPGLINTHDHITFTQNNPYVAGNAAERYEDRQQWRKGQDGHTKIPSSGGASADQIRWGELRFLMGGATSIVGSGGQPGLLRNLDSANQEGLNHGSVNFDTFPLGDSAGTKRTGDCNYGGSPTTATTIASDPAYEPHTSEGIDDTARNEFLCESSATFDTTAPGTSNNLLIGKTAMIHAIGLQPADYGAMATAGTALIWSPRSNISLYGDTARVTIAEKLGVEIALGTDWMPTGSMNLLRELKCADSFNQTYLHFFTDVQLWQMVTTAPASITATDDVLGLLATGKTADISIFNAHGGKTFRAVIDADPPDVVLVMRGGKVLYGDDAAVNTLAQQCDVVDVCGTSKRVCLMSEVGKTYTALQTAAGNIYPAFACGVPDNEPTCVPSRGASVAGSTIYTGMATPDDSDGDGIPDSMDKCPNTFDPIRPVDNGVQGDADGDGVGDACDPCPLDANTNTCSTTDPNDRDHDGIANDADNCPDVANPDQADADHDGKGDACDACPNDANPGSAGCSESIYAVKNGTVPAGTVVHIANAIVTGRGANGFFIQVKEGDAGYMGSDNSGLFVFTNTGSPLLANATVGARVDVDGRVANFQGQIELDNVTTVTVDAVGPEAPPAPITATYTEVKTGGTRAAALESVIVKLGAATVTATDAMFVEFTLTAGADTLVGDDFLFAPTPPLAVGQAVNGITGILAMRQMASKLEPRAAADLDLGPPGLASFGPAQSFVRIGETANAPTFPAPLTVTLSGPAQGDTTVTIVSGDPTKLTVTDVVVPNGQTSVAVKATAVLQSANVTVTATLGVQQLTANVRVLGAVEAPTTVTLSPLTATVSPGGTVTLTASLDIPPAIDTQIGLAQNPAGSGTLPATVTILKDTLSATFQFVDSAATGPITITASFGASTSQTTITIATGPSHLVISQVYGGGGNSGAPLTNDFVELFNPTDASIPLGGLSVQYASATGTTWLVTTLPAISVPAGGYLLIMEAGGTTGSPLPTPDVTGSTNMSATNGKVMLVTGTTALTGACPTANVIDRIGYGTANCSETANAPAGTNTTALQRGGAGCVDTDSNSADFTSVSPNPRNSATTPQTCN